MSRKIKVAYIVHGLGAEGISSFTVNLMSRLDMDKYDISIIMSVDDNGEPQKREAEVKAFGVKFYRTCDLQTTSRIKRHLELLEEILVKTGPYDAVHVNMDMLNGLNLKVAKKAGVPVRISHSHTSGGKRYSNPVKNVAVNFYRCFMRHRINKYATHRIGCSDFANSYLYNNYESHVVINGIDTNKFLETNVDIKECRASLKVPENNKIIVAVARIEEIKNPFYTVKIISELAKIRDDFTFVWIGDGHLRKDMEKCVSENNLNDKYLFAGIRTDVPQILKCADIFLLPSLREGLPISAVEAQCSGCDCVIADTVTRLVDGGKCTFLPIGENDTVKWAEKINELLDAEKTVLSEATISNFDVQTMADRVAEFYDLAKLQKQ
ncbi:MAG: glycosyltransferase [Clostridia bacterium]|nr:glycosyltransferase [Clostridia bacterium]